MCIEQHLKVSSAYSKRFPVWNRTNTFAEASKTAVAQVRNWKRKEGTQVEYFYVACSRFLSCSWFLPPTLIDQRIYKYLVAWVPVTFMAYMAYCLLNYNTVYYSLSYIKIFWSRKITQHWGSDRVTKNLVRSNTFVDYCYVITRHIQDGALQVTKEAMSKCSHYNRELEKNGTYFRIPEEKF